MIRIPKRDAFKIREICGTDAICSTHTKHKTYYIVENPDYLKVYEELKGNKNIKE